MKLGFLLLENLFINIKREDSKNPDVLDWNQKDMFS